MVRGTRAKPIDVEKAYGKRGLFKANAQARLILAGQDSFRHNEVRTGVYEQ